MELASLVYLFFGGWLWFPFLNVHDEEDKKRIALECATAERNNQMWICECMWINAWMIFNG
jgi:hypothetical protein